MNIRFANSGTVDGPVVLLTSPWPESLLAFRGIWPLLTDTGRLVAVDLPGFGHSEGRPDVLNPAAMGEFLGRFIAELGLGQPHLVAPDVGAARPCSWPHAIPTRSPASSSAAAAQPIRST